MEALSYIRLNIKGCNYIIPPIPPIPEAPPGMGSLPDGNSAERKFPFNPNGSVYDIAGICDPTGRIFGLMPHPEAFNHVTNHPDWTRNREIMKRQGKKPDSNLTTGIRVFKNGVDFIARKNI